MIQKNKKATTWTLVFTILAVLVLVIIGIALAYKYGIDIFPWARNIPTPGNQPINSTETISFAYDLALNDVEYFDGATRYPFKDGKIEVSDYIFDKTPINDAFYNLYYLPVRTEKRIALAPGFGKNIYPQDIYNRLPQLDACILAIFTYDDVYNKRGDVIVKLVARSKNPDCKNSRSYGDLSVSLSGEAKIKLVKSDLATLSNYYTTLKSSDVTKIITEVNIWRDSVLSNSITIPYYNAETKITEQAAVKAERNGLYLIAFLTKK